MRNGICGPEPTLIIWTFSSTNDYHTSSLWMHFPLQSLWSMKQKDTMRREKDTQGEYGYNFFRLVWTNFKLPVLVVFTDVY